MIHSITFKDPGSEHVAYELTLPALKGKTFNFKPGVNLIIGANGSGKTSLINVIRTLTLCKNHLGSAEFFEEELPQLEIGRIVEQGYYKFCSMPTQFSCCTFNVRKDNELPYRGSVFSTFSASCQIMSMSRHSHGQNTLAAFSRLIMYLQNGQDAFSSGNDKPKKQKTENGIFPHQDFQISCIDKLRKVKTEDCQTAVKWYDENRFIPRDQKKYKDYAGFTILADEPDEGLDIENAEELLIAYTKCPKTFQQIAVMHNIGLIHRILHCGIDVNLIELTPGYAEKVEKFLSCK